MSRLFSFTAGALLLIPGVFATPPDTGSVPIYRVTVVSRTLQAVNYEHLGKPTSIGFQGTMLLPGARGEATVESKRGRIMINAKFERLEAPAKFGPEYLTYVLWAITPEGRAKNLGELVMNSSNKAKIEVSTALQSLGLMVTAEPYYAVTTPSDVVVIENVIGPDTTGKREVVKAKYELLPRGRYTMTMPAGSRQPAVEEGRKMPYDRYEARLEVLQAQNAVRIAQSMGADRYAADTFQKAQKQAMEAQRMEASKQDTHVIVSEAREAAQMAEDSRALAVRRAEEEHMASLQRETAAAHAGRDRAEKDAREARASAVAEHREAESQRATADQAQAEAAQSEALASQREREAQAAGAEAIQAKLAQSVSLQKQSRAELLAQLNGILPTRDTPRGLLVTVPDSMVDRAGLSDKINRLATILATHRNLTLHVEGFADDDAVSEKRAQLVRDLLLAGGLTPDSVTAAGLGNSRPIAPATTAAGREQNRRVEIVIAGQEIGDTATAPSC